MKYEMPVAHMFVGPYAVGATLMNNDSIDVIPKVPPEGVGEYVCLDRGEDPDWWGENCSEGQETEVDNK